MSFIDIFTISLTALRRNKIRTFLTSFAVFIGVFIIIFLVSLSNGAQEVLISQITNQFDIKSIFVLKKGTLILSFFTPTVKQDSKEESKIINNDTIASIKNINNVQRVDALAPVFARKLEFSDKTFDDRVVESARGAGWDLAENDSIVTEVFAGKYSNIAEDELVLTKDVVNAYGKNPQEVIGQKVKLTDIPSLLGSQSKSIGTREFTIVGVIANVRDFVYIVNLNSALKDISIKNGYTTTDEYVNTAGYQSLYVKSFDEESVDEIAEEIRGQGYDVSTLEEILELFNTFFNIIPLIFTIVGAIAIFVASIGIINTMVMSVYERTKEIGVMKAVGARNSTITGLFITEAGLIGFIGGSVAVIVSLLIMALINNILVNRILPELGIKNISNFFITPPSLIIITVVASTFVGILAGLYPAIRASRLNPVAALRYE